MFRWNMPFPWTLTFSWNIVVFGCPGRNRAVAEITTPAEFRVIGKEAPARLHIIEAIDT